MIKLDKFNIINNYTNNLLQWSFTPDSIVPENLKLNIYRSESSGIDGELIDYTMLKSEHSVQEDYQDFNVNKINDRVWYYKLETSDGFLLTQKPTYIKNSPKDKVIKEIIRRKTLSLNKFTARNFILLKKRTWGEHCSKSWDSTLFRDTNPNCPECFGTGWTGGYFTPIPFKAMINAAPKYNQILMFGEWKPSDVMLYTLNYPLLNCRDVVVDDEAKRWLVVQIRQIKKLGYLIEQQAQLALIANDDAIYKVNIL